MVFGGRRAVMLVVAVTGVAGLTTLAGPGGALAGARTAAAPASGVTSTWRVARIPGVATLNQGGDAQVGSVSCASARSDHGQPFVVSEVRGTWHNAIKVPGITTFNKGADAVIDSVSCPSAGHCGAAGSYTDSAKRYQAFAAGQG